MEKLILGGIEMRLVGISYKVGKSSSSDVTVEDNYVLEKIEKDSVHLIFERDVTMNFERKERLKIKVKVVRFAEENVDLMQEISDDYIKENINKLLGPALSFMSALVAQITGSFGELPFITAPSFYDEEDYNKEDEEE